MVLKVEKNLIVSMNSKNLIRSIYFWRAIEVVKVIHESGEREDYVKRFN